LAGWQLPKALATHLVLCRIEHGLARPDMTVDRYLPSVDVALAYMLRVIDELGYVPPLRIGTESQFEVLNRRYGCGSIFVTSDFRSASGRARLALNGSSAYCSAGSHITSRFGDE
jgi:hypothetical protein